MQTACSLSGTPTQREGASHATACMVHVIHGRLSVLRIPVQTLFDGLGQGCVAVAMSHDARFVATLSMGVPQVQLYIYRPVAARTFIS